ARYARSAPPMAPDPVARLGKASLGLPLGAGAAEAALAARARRERGDLAPGGAGDGRDHQLRDAVAAPDARRLAPEVDEQHLHLAAVVGVDRARRRQRASTSSPSAWPFRSPSTVRASASGRKRRRLTRRTSSLVTASMPAATSSSGTSRPK